MFIAIWVRIAFVFWNAETGIKKRAVRGKWTVQQRQQIVEASLVNGASINEVAERYALRAVALGRKNYLFAGADCGGERAAAIYLLIGTAKLNGIDPESYLRYVLNVIADHPINGGLIPYLEELVRSQR